MPVLTLLPLQSDVPHGLTYNWNVAYRIFKENTTYTALFLVNNDMQFPDGTFVEMAKVGFRSIGRSRSHRNPCIRW